jgi:hypothetical protein
VPGLWQVFPQQKILAQVSHLADFWLRLFYAESRSCPLRCSELHSQCFLCLAVHGQCFLVCLSFDINFVSSSFLKAKAHNGAALLPVYFRTFLKSFARRFAVLWD